FSRCRIPGAEPSKETPGFRRHVVQQLIGIPSQSVRGLSASAAAAICAGTPANGARTMSVDWRIPGPCSSASSIEGRLGDDFQGERPCADRAPLETREASDRSPDMASGYR
ncbi:MAG TPA: hypothetical protein VKA25_11790, partial [Gemmatimonadales bacterium]|nr:hypothetical protein [Gemmatimonadales bacterium]